jgi:rod shape-determining protein MreD
VRSAAFLLVGVLLVLVQGTTYRLLAAFDGLSVAGYELGRLLAGGTPNLVLPLVVFLGVNEPSMARGALLSLGLGWALDIMGGGPAFLFRFTMVTVWLLALVASSRVSTQSVAMRVPLAFAASLVESLLVLILLAIFGQDPQRSLDLTRIALPRAITTALLAPFLFALAHRLSLEGWGSGASGSAKSG